MTMFDVVEKTVPQLRAALESGQTTAVELVQAYQQRIERYDRPDPSRTDGLAADGQVALNSVVVDNPSALAEARASDERRAAGESLGPLDGIPYTAKDSYMVRGLTVAAGSPAFQNLVAQVDAFTIERLRAAGAVLIGLTNMPPMANGGMQRGVYGRAESPYNDRYLTSAFASGSSNGSGTATSASFAAFGLGEETWSSGRAPASCNALCAYTPSRGVISMRGNWQLVPTMDVVVPHTRTMEDLLEVLDVIVADDPVPRGDFWRTQPWVEVPRASEVRPDSYVQLDGENSAGALGGLRLGVPRMYINSDPEAGTGPDHTDQPGIGGPMGRQISTRDSVIRRWQQARTALEAAGASVVDVDFPVVTHYEGDRPGAPTIATRGLVSPEFLLQEVGGLAAWSWEDFLQANGDPALSTLDDVDGDRIFPHPAGTLEDRYHGFGDDIATYPNLIRRCGGDGVGERHELTDLPELAEGVAGLEQTRHEDLEVWMDALELDAVVFPAMADVGPADADVNPDSADLAWRNGVWVANANLVPRHLGIPTVTVPMGTLDDIGVPVGLTFAGRAYDDTKLLALALAFETVKPERTPPPQTTTNDQEKIMTTESPAYRSMNPATGQTVSEHPFATDEQINQTVADSVEAYQQWQARSIEDRAQVVQRVADLFAERTEDLAQIITREMGKPIAESREEAEFCADIFGYYATHGPQLASDHVLEDSDEAYTVIQRRGLGPLLGIMPWNFPYYQVARFASPNLVLGNTIMLKHAENCPEAALAIQQVMDDAGIPAGVYQNVFATHDQAATIIADPRVQGVSLTGSERAGASVAAQAGAHLKKAVLELGGSDPYVVLSSNDARAAARTALEVRMENTGQACNSNKRIIVMDDIYDEFVDEMVARVGQLTPDDPAADKENTFGPLTSQGAAEKLLAQLQRATEAGANLRVGGDRLDREGYYIAPTVMTDLPVASDVYREEFFGPVVQIFRASSDAEALELANNTQYGLGSAVFATEDGRAEKFAEQLQAGMVGANQSPPETEHMPFGGVKGSGYGRELGPLGMDEFVNKRLMATAKKK